MIFEAIAAIKVANDAIAAIKEMAGNVQSVGQLGSHLTKLTDAEDEIKKKATDGDMDAFFALEKINQQKAEIKQMMIYSGRAGLWEDWQRFQATRRELRENQRRRAEAKRLAKKKAIKNGLMYSAVGIFTLGIVGGAVAFIFWLISLKGN